MCDFSEELLALEQKSLFKVLPSMLLLIIQLSQQERIQIECIAYWPDWDLKPPPSVEGNDALAILSTCYMNK